MPDTWYGSADLLHEEVRQACDERRRRLSAWERQVKEFHGRYYRGAGKSEGAVSNPSPKNFAYSWITRALAEMAWENPRCDVDAIGPGVTSQDSLLRKVGLNQWINDVDLATILADGPLLHAQWHAGYLLLSPDPIRDMRPVEVPPVGGWDERGPRKRQPTRPHVYAIPPNRVFEDPAATCRDEIRFIGWDWKRPKQSIIEEAKAHPERGWNLDMLELMDADKTTDEQGQRWSPEGVDVKRGEVHGVSVWVPEAKIDEKNTSRRFYHGAIYTLPASGAVSEDWEGEWLRPPRDFFGPPCGPIHAFGVYVIPGYAGFMGPLTGTQEQAESLAATARANTKSARNYKVVVIVNDKNAKLANQLRSAKHQYIYTATDYKHGDADQLAYGGLTDQQLVQEQREQENLDDVSGMSELRRGNATGKATATENAIAADNASARFDWINKRMYAPTQRLLQAVSDYLENDSEILYPLSGESAAQLGYKPMQAVDERGQLLVGADGKPLMISRPVWFRGGREKEDSHVVSRVRIVPKSMSRKNQAQELQSTVAFHQWLATMLPAFRMHPEAAWPDIVNQVAEAMSLPKQAHLIDWELVEVFAEQQYQMQITMQQAELARAPAFEGMQGQGQTAGGPSWWRNAPTPQGRAPGARGAAGLGSPGFSMPNAKAQPALGGGQPRPGGGGGGMKQPRPGGTRAA